MTDKEILDFQAGGLTLREMGGITFLQWLAGKINGLSTYTAANQELLLAVSNPPMGALTEDSKLRLVRKLLSLNVSL